MSRASYNNPQFIPFQSGSTLCYPSKDYADFNGGGNSFTPTAFPRQHTQMMQKQLTTLTCKM